MIINTRWPRLLLGLLLAGGLAACDKNNNDDEESGPPPAPTVSLTAAPTTLVQGAATTLTWSSTDATACTASGAWTGSRAVSGTEANTPAAVGTASYTLTCTGAGGSGNATATVTVTAPPPPVAPTVTLSAAPTSIALGSPTTLTWSSTNAVSCTASGAWSGSRAVSGSLSNTPAAAGTASYTLTCTGPGGSANASATVTVNPLPTVTISAAPTTLTLGAASTLTWSSSNTTACTASGGWTGTRTTSGTASVTPVATGSIPYTLTCTGPGGSATATASVTVNPVPTVSLSAAPTTLILGNSSTLTWSSSNTTGCTASGAWSGSRAVSGAETVTPSAVGDASYTLTCTGAGGSVAATAVVTVNAVPTVAVTFEGKLTSAGNSSGGPTADGEVADAAIQLLVNGSEFIGTTDIDGNYSVTASVPADVTTNVSVLLIGRRLLPSGLEIYFLSQLGSFEQARVLAGADGVLTADEEFRVNITPFTTAEVSLEQEILRGEIDLGIAGASELSGRTAGKRIVPSARPMQATNVDTPLDRFIDELRMSIDYTQALGAATTISLVADRGVPAPFGIADTYSLAFFRDVRLFFIEDQQLNNALAYEAALADTLANRDTTRGISAAEVPLQAVAAVVGDVSEEALIGNGGSAFSASQFRFDPGGTGTYSSFDLRSDDVRWTVNADSIIEVRFGTPPSVSFEAVTFDDNGNAIFGFCTDSRPEIDLQPISTNAARQRVRQTRECEPALAALNFTFDELTTVLFAGLDTFPASSAEDFAGRSFAIEVPSLIGGGGRSDPTSLAGDRLQFNADFTGSTRFLGLTFNWAVDGDGNLQVTYSNGTSSVLRLLRPLFDGANLVLMSNTIDSGTYTNAQPMFEANEALTFTPESVVGTHYQHGVGTVPALEFVDFARPATLSEVSLLKGFAIELFPSGVATTVNDRLVTDGSGAVVRLAPPSADINNGLTWALRDDGSLILERYFTFSGSDRSICTIGTTNPDCYLIDRREVFPIFLLGERQGWLERRIINESSEPGPIVGTTALLIRTYVQAPNGDFALPRVGNFAPIRSSPQTVRPPLRPDANQHIAQERGLKLATTRGDRKAAQRIEKLQRVHH